MYVYFFSLSHPRASELPLSRSPSDSLPPHFDLSVIGLQAFWPPLLHQWLALNMRPPPTHGL